MSNARDEKDIDKGIIDANADIDATLEINAASLIAFVNGLKARVLHICRPDLLIDFYNLDQPGVLSDCYGPCAPKLLEDSEITKLVTPAHLIQAGLPPLPQNKSMHDHIQALTSVQKQNFIGNLTNQKNKETSTLFTKLINDKILFMHTSDPERILLHRVLNSPVYTFKKENDSLSRGGVRAPFEDDAVGEFRKAKENSPHLEDRLFCQYIGLFAIVQNFVFSLATLKEQTNIQLDELSATLQLINTNYQRIIELLAKIKADNEPLASQSIKEFELALLKLKNNIQKVEPQKKLHAQKILNTYMRIFLDLSRLKAINNEHKEADPDLSGLLSNLNKTAAGINTLSISDLNTLEQNAVIEGCRLALMTLEARTNNGNAATKEIFARYKKIFLELEKLYTLHNQLPENQPNLSFGLKMQILDLSLSINSVANKIDQTPSDEILHNLQQDAVFIGCQPALAALKEKTDAYGPAAKKIYDEYEKIFLELQELHGGRRETNAAVTSDLQSNLIYLNTAIYNAADAINKKVKPAEIDKLHHEAAAIGCKHALSALKRVVNEKNQPLQPKDESKESKIAGQKKKTENLTKPSEDLLEHLLKRNITNEIAILRNNVFREAAYIQDPTPPNKLKFEEALAQSPKTSAWNRWKWKVAMGASLVIAGVAIGIATGGLGLVGIAAVAAVKYTTVAALGYTAVASLIGSTIKERWRDKGPRNRYSLFVEKKTTSQPEDKKNSVKSENLPKPTLGKK
jgi:hypothetical protein